MSKLSALAVHNAKPNNKPYKLSDGKEATLKSFGENPGNKFLDQLNKPDPMEALLGFAVDFIKTHLPKEHLAIVLLVRSESTKASELTRSFFHLGPDETGRKLDEFSQERFQMEDTGYLIRIWTGILLSMSAGVLMGQSHPNENEIEEYAAQATNLFSGLYHNNS